MALSHPEAYPQIDFKIEDKLDAMLQDKAAGDSQRPRSWEDLQQRLHIVPVNTGTFVPYNLPYKNWQRAFYVASNDQGCQTFIMEIDNCITHTLERTERPKFGQFTLNVQIGRNVGFKLTKNDFDYPLVEVTHGLAAADLAVTPLQVYPPSGVRPLVVHFEAVNEVCVAMTFFGDTYRHRHALGRAGLEMSKEEPGEDSEEASNAYSPSRKTRLETFYLMASKDVSVEAESTFVTKLLTDDVANVIIDLRVVSPAKEDTVTYTFVNNLKKIPNLLVREV